MNYLILQGDDDEDGDDDDNDNDSETESHSTYWLRISLAKMTLNF